MSTPADTPRPMKFPSPKHTRLLMRVDQDGPSLIPFLSLNCDSQEACEQVLAMAMAIAMRSIDRFGSQYGANLTDTTAIIERIHTKAEEIRADIEVHAKKKDS